MWKGIGYRECEVLVIHAVVKRKDAKRLPVQLGVRVDEIEAPIKRMGKDVRTALF